MAEGSKCICSGLHSLPSLGPGNELAPKVLPGDMRMRRSHGGFWRESLLTKKPPARLLGSKPSGNMDMEACKESKETSETVRSVF